MTLTAIELSLINIALQTKPSEREVGKLERREFPELGELKTAIDIADKLQTCTEGEGAEKKFKDSEVELSTSQKSFALGLLSRPWGVDDGRSYLALKEKLEA